MKEFNGINISEPDQMNDLQKQQEFQNLIETIDLQLDESYDCNMLNVWSYRKATDIRDGVQLKFGNMVNGFPFELGGVRFFNSECAYIAGAYSGQDDDSIRIQKLIINERNGMKCKRIYRRLPEFTYYQRKDFYSFNIQYMQFLNWQRALQSKDFANILRCIPIDAHVVENTSYHHGESAIFWGAKNIELKQAREVAEAEVAKKGVFRYKKDLAFAQMLAANKINNVGTFVGRNVMGKIIKICSLSLIYRQEPPIDYNLLMSKDLFMIGNLIEFPIN